MKGKKNSMQKPSLYGFHAVHEAWLNPQRDIQALYITPQAQKGFEETIKQAEQKNLQRPAPSVVDRQQLEKMLPKGAVHQGLALACRPLEDLFLQDLIIQAEARDRTVLLMLDQVTDPHNVGAIIRSACALGANGMIMQKKHAPELAGVLAKTASGAVEHLPVACETNLSRAIEDLKEHGFFVYGLDEHGAQSIADITPQPKEKIVLVLGAEGSGLRRLVKENCDALVRLPTREPIASLNVSNAAAIALYTFCIE